jgi:acetyl esterase/lipase
MAVNILASNPYHPDLRGARWLPPGLGSPSWMWLMRRLPMPPVKVPPPLTVTERNIDEAGNVKALIISPPPDGRKRPTLLWIHGGGYIIGSPKQDLALCARYAQRLDLVIVAVDYRLAPEHPYPTPLDDCFSAFEFIHREASSLGIDPARIVIGGASAGGGLAASLTLLIHDRRRPAPALQLLVYPMLDDRTISPSVERRFHRLWNRRSNEFGWRSYLGKTPGGPDVPDHAAPARREDLSGLPPAWIGVGTLDLFHDEDLVYAARLRDAGISTTVEIVPGAFHGFDAVMPAKPVAKHFFESQVSAIEQQVGHREPA